MTGTPQKLKYSAYGRKVIISLERMSDRIASLVNGMKSVKHAESQGNDLVLEVSDPETDNADIINGIVRAGGRIRFVSEQGHSLEDAYIKLLGENIEQ
jgi:ABC-2 type transport system ATP-binding protein